MDEGHEEREERYIARGNIPWWLRILERQGIATLFAVVLLAGMWRLGDRHLVFLDAQTAQASLQTRILEQIRDSVQQQQAAISMLRDSFLAEAAERRSEHAKIMERLDR